MRFSATGVPEFLDGSSYESALGNPFLFNGREWDPELGLYYYRNRYMSPLLGRFTTPDPLGAFGDPETSKKPRDQKPDAEVSAGPR